MKLKIRTFCKNKSEQFQFIDLEFNGGFHEIKDQLEKLFKDEQNNVVLCAYLMEIEFDNSDNKVDDISYATIEQVKTLMYQCFVNLIPDLYEDLISGCENLIQKYNELIQEYRNLILSYNEEILEPKKAIVEFNRVTQKENIDEFWQLPLLRIDKMEIVENEIKQQIENIKEIQKFVNSQRHFVNSIINVCEKVICESEKLIESYKEILLKLKLKILEQKCNKETIIKSDQEEQKNIYESQNSLKIEKVKKIEDIIINRIKNIKEILELVIQEKKNSDILQKQVDKFFQKIAELKTNDQKILVQKNEIVDKNKEIMQKIVLQENKIPDKEISIKIISEMKKLKTYLEAGIEKGLVYNKKLLNLLSNGLYSIFKNVIDESYLDMYPVQPVLCKDEKSYFSKQNLQNTTENFICITSVMFENIYQKLCEKFKTVLCEQLTDYKNGVHELFIIFCEYNIFSNCNDSDSVNYYVYLLKSGVMYEVTRAYWDNFASQEIFRSPQFKNDKIKGFSKIKIIEEKIYAKISEREKETLIVQLPKNLLFCLKKKHEQSRGELIIENAKSLFCKLIKVFNVYGFIFLNDNIAGKRKYLEQEMNNEISCIMSSRVYEDLIDDTKIGTKISFWIGFFIIDITVFVLTGLLISKFLFFGGLVAPAVLLIARFGFNYRPNLFFFSESHAIIDEAIKRDKKKCLEIFETKLQRNINKTNDVAVDEKRVDSHNPALYLNIS